MRFREFITANLEPILSESEAFARGFAPGAKLERPALCDGPELILRASVRDMGTTQTFAQPASKSKGVGGAGGDESESLDAVSSAHGAARVGAGFDLIQVVSEFRALRSSVLRRWRASNPAPNPGDLEDITRFNESMDQSLLKAVAAYTHRVDQIRSMFLGVLGHELRNRLNTISLSAQLVSCSGWAPADSSSALSQIEGNVQSIDRLIKDLSDFASTGLGTTMALTLAPTNLKVLCREAVDAIESGNPVRQINLKSQGGDMRLIGDIARLRKAIYTLLANAIQRGPNEGPVTLSTSDEVSGLVLTVHHLGAAIPADLLSMIVDSMMSSTTARDRRLQRSTGLGLYLVREIVTAHGGSVEVTSSESAGTLISVRIPRQPGNARAG
jgi:signal transduction histidine kinase